MEDGKIAKEIAFEMPQRIYERDAQGNIVRETPFNTFEPVAV
jgi:hypothetical protein